jgi:hypothetical protein
LNKNIISKILLIKNEKTNICQLQISESHCKYNIKELNIPASLVMRKNIIT